MDKELRFKFLARLQRHKKICKNCWKRIDTRYENFPTTHGFYCKLCYYFFYGQEYATTKVHDNEEV